MDKVFGFVITYAERKWRQPVGALLAGIAVAALVFSATEREERMSLGWRLIAAAVGVSLTAFAWWASNRTPRVTKGRVGFIVSLACEDDKHERRIRADFIDKLRQLIETDAETTRFQVVVYPRFIAERVVDERTAGEYHEKSRGHFMVYGRVRERPAAGGGIMHYVDIEGRVRHAPVDTATQRIIASDFAAVLPRRIQIRDEFTVFAFEATSEWVDVASRYIVAIAALVTGDLAYAETLFLNVESRLPATTGRYAPLRRVAQNLPGHLVTLYHAWLAHLTSEYTRLRDDRFLSQAGEIASKLLARDPKNYNGLLVQAMVVFRLHGDVARAKAIVRSAKRQDVTWRYSLAFLLAYEGDLNGAQVEYHRAFNGKTDDVSVPVQCEEFIQIVLSDAPERAALHYCSALINLKAKIDAVAAKRDLTLFVDHPKSAAYPAQVAEAHRLLASMP